MIYYFTTNPAHQATLYEGTDPKPIAVVIVVERDTHAEATVVKEVTTGKSVSWATKQDAIKKVRRLEALWLVDQKQKNKEYKAWQARRAAEIVKEAKEKNARRVEAGLEPLFSEMNGRCLGIANGFVGGQIQSDDAKYLRG